MFMEYKSVSDQRQEPLEHFLSAAALWYSLADGETRRRKGFSLPRESFPLKSL